MNRHHHNAGPAPDDFGDADHQVDEGLRDLLLSAVPPQPTIPRRLQHVARRVRRRRQRRAAMGSIAVMALGLTGFALWGQGGAILVTTDLTPADDGQPVTTPVPDGGDDGAETTSSPPTSQPDPAVTVTPPGTGQQPGGDNQPGTPGPQGSTTSMDPGGPPIPGLAFDANAIPPGHPGSHEARIATTGELPDRTVVPGIFRTVCQYSHMGTADSMSRGAGPVPLRSYWGNTAAGSSAQAGASTCRGGTVDRSTYWSASLIDTATGSPLAPTQAIVFYSRSYGVPAEAEVRPLPDDLQMAVTAADAATGRVDYNCGSGSWSTTLPDCTPSATLTMRYMFPQCWDGAQSDTADHRSHLSYASEGQCPQSHPVVIPEVAYHLSYVVPSGGTSALRSSTDGLGPGEPMAGFANGWLPEIAATWASRCIQAGLDCRAHLLGDGRVIESDF